MSLLTEIYNLIRDSCKSELHARWASNKIERHVLEAKTNNGGDMHGCIGSTLRCDCGSEFLLSVTAKRPSGETDKKADDFKRLVEMICCEIVSKTPMKDYDTWSCPFCFGSLTVSSMPPSFSLDSIPHSEGCSYLLAKKILKDHF